MVIRELVQNVLDARLPNHCTGQLGFARIRIKCISGKNGLDVQSMKKMCAPVIPHLESSGHDSKGWGDEDIGALVIEETGTTGLIGKTDESHYDGSDRSEQRWNRFWFGEADESKSGGSLGRRGQGKITYHLASGTYSVFALTTQSGGAKDLLFGKTIFAKTHNIGSDRYSRHSYYCEKGEVLGEMQPLPITDKKRVASFKKVFDINRNSDDSGTTWVIPYVNFSTWKTKYLIESIVSEFYIAICNGAISFDLEGMSIDQNNLNEVLNKYKIFKTDAQLEYVKWVIDSLNAGPESITLSKDWFDKKNQPAKQSCLDEKEFEKASKDFRNGKTVSFRVPIPLVLKSGNETSSFVQVYLQNKEEKNKTYEEYVRECLLISEEKGLVLIPGKYFGLMIATDIKIVDFLGCAESASHLKWNQKNPALEDNYKRYQETLSMVRSSLPCLGLLLSEITSKETDEIFDDILSLPKPKGAPKKKAKSRIPNPPGPPRVLQPLKFEQNGSKIVVDQGPGFSALLLPSQTTLEFAYDTLGEVNAFKQYKHFDFDFGVEKQFKIKTHGCVVESKDSNIIELKIIDNSFRLEIVGFDDAKLLIKEKF